MVMTIIDDKAQELLDVLRALGPGWHDRDAIVSKLDKRQRSASKPQLSAVEIATLELLTAQGKIEQSKIPTRRPHILRSVYRLKESKSK